MANDIDEKLLAAAEAVLESIGHAGHADALDGLRKAVADARRWRDGVACEHGVADGDWCEACAAEYKKARKENGYE